MSSTSTDLVPVGEHGLMVPDVGEKQAIVLMDRTDLDQAMAELRGEVVAQFVYVAKGKKQLSYAGIKEAARLYRNVHFGATATPLPDGGWMITSYAHNLADNTRVDYPMPYPPFDPADPAQSIEFRATLSKSLRNALAAVLPIAYLNSMIARWMDQQGGGQQGTRRDGSAATASGATATVAGATATATASAKQAAAHQSSVGSRPSSENGTAPTTDDRRPTTETDWTGTGAQLRARIERDSGLELRTGQDWANLARLYDRPEPLRAADMTQEWLLALHQEMTRRAYAEEIEAATSEREVITVVQRALGDRDKRHIGVAHYDALSARGEARKAELSAPLLAGVPHAVAS